MAPPSSGPIRIYAGAFAVVLGLQSAWLLAAEISRPALPFFPMNGAEAKAAAMHGSAAATAAWIGWPRGELWVNYAITANAALFGNLEDRAVRNGNRADGNAISVVEMAAALAPSDARAWLLLAGVHSQSAMNTTQAFAQLKMSYYTSPYNEYLFPLRIQIIARSTTTFDDELRGFAEYELRKVIRDRPELKRSIASAFRFASPAGRQFLETSIGGIDPKFLSELKTISP
jgi:hypothetical protein